MSNIYQAVIRYLHKTEHYTTRRFIIELALVVFIPKLFIGILVSGLMELLPGGFQEPTQEIVKDFTSGNLMVALFALVIATTFVPLLETVLFQWLPIAVVQKFTRQTRTIVLASAILFSLFHADVFIAAVVFPLGIVLAWSFIVHRRVSRWHAVWVTAAIHSIHNLIALFLNL